MEQIQLPSYQDALSVAEGVCSGQVTPEQYIQFLEESYEALDFVENNFQNMDIETELIEDFGFELTSLMEGFASYRDGLGHLEAFLEDPREDYLENGLRLIQSASAKFARSRASNERKIREAEQELQSD